LLKNGIECSVLTLDLGLTSNILKSLEKASIVALPLKHLYNLIIGKRIIKDAVKYIAITADEIAQMRAYGIDQDDIVYIPNGVSQDEFCVSDGGDFRKQVRFGGLPLYIVSGLSALLRVRICFWMPFIG